MQACDEWFLTMMKDIGIAVRTREAKTDWPLNSSDLERLAQKFSSRANERIKAHTPRKR